MRMRNDCFRQGICCLGIKFVFEEIFGGREVGSFTAINQDGMPSWSLNKSAETVVNIKENYSHTSVPLVRWGRVRPRYRLNFVHPSDTSRRFGQQKLSAFDSDLCLLQSYITPEEPLCLMKSFAFCLRFFRW